MTVNATSNRQYYTGDGTSTVFAYPFKIQQTEDLEVSIDGVVKQETTHYTVTGAGLSGGGNVTFITAPLPGTVVLLKRLVPLTQEQGIANNETVLAEVLDTALDKLTMITQQLSDTLGRTITLVETDPGGAQLRLPTLTARANKYVAFNSGGDIVVAEGTTSSPTADRRVTLFSEDRGNLIAGQMTFVPTGGYLVGFVDVYKNGVKMELGVDFIANNGADVVLAVGVLATDLVEVIAWGAVVTTAPVGGVTDSSLAPGSRVFNRVNDWVSVKDAPYSAAGNGTANDAAAISAAATACAASGATLFFPAGTYRVTSNITIPENCTIDLTSARLLPTSGVVITINGNIVAPPKKHIFDISLGGSFAGVPFNEELYPEWWGAKGDGTSSVVTTAAIQAAVLFCINADQRYKIKLLGRKYTLSSPIIMSSGGRNYPLIEGRSRQKTTIEHKYVTPLKSVTDVGGVSVSIVPAFHVTGGRAFDSGSQAVFRWLEFDGVSNLSHAILFEDCAFAWAEECYFKNQGACALMLNETPGSFTEFSGLRNCHYFLDNGSIIRYVRVLGDGSFHGAGIDGGVINEASTNTRALIRIGSACRPYNSPLRIDGLFKQSAQPLISAVDSNGGFIYFHGYICGETFAENIWEYASGTNIAFLGDLMEIGGEGAGNPERGPRLGTLQPAFRVDNNGVGGFALMPLPRPLRYRHTVNPSGFIPQSLAPGAYAEIIIRVSAVDYEYVKKVDLYVEPVGNQGFLQQAATIRILNGTGWGEPTIAWDPATYRLTVNNAAYPTDGSVTVHAQINYKLMGASGFFE